jgi:MFS superfamily sulfate permease-like transporter
MKSITCSSSSNLETPIRTAREARKLVKVVKNSINISTKELDRLAQTIEEISIENKLLYHKVNYLKSIIIDQHKRRKNPQPLALDNELQEKAGWFVSLKKLAKALEERDAIETQILEEKKLKKVVKTEQQVIAQLRRDQVEARKREMKEKRERKRT